MGAFLTVLSVAALPLGAVAHQLNAGLVSFVLLVVPFAVVGVVLSFRLPRNPIGWIFLLLSLGLILGTDAGAYAVRAYRIGHHGLPLSRLAVAMARGWIAFVLLPLPVLLFPEGRVEGRAWRWTLRLYLTIAAMFVLAIVVGDLRAFTDRTVEVDSSGELAGGSPHGALAAIAGVGLALLAAITLSWVARLLVRFRRASGEERQQNKWLMSGGATCIVGFLISILLNGAHSEPWYAVAQTVPFAVAALPLGMGVAILRYRLYDLERLISRTISYLVVTGVLLGLFIGIVLLATRVLPFSSPVAVAASTLARRALQPAPKASPTGS